MTEPLTGEIDVMLLRVMPLHLVAMCSIVLPAVAGAAETALTRKEPAIVESIQGAHWRFGGEMGRRIDANVENWLLRAPGANPGLLEMFHRRDRHLPYAEPVPWAGEFAGKYLISAVQALRMSEDPKLRAFVQTFVEELIAGQAEDGYLGPWPKDQRLLGHWDLWGHYHCMLGLLMWHADTGDTRAWDCVLRMADRMLATYAKDRRPIEAGTPAINLSAYHVLAILYGKTGDTRYLDLLKRFEDDMTQEGDWLRKGEAGTPYCQLQGMGTRWESLHLVQGFAEMYRITGDARYKKAFTTLWESIRQYDRHPTGAFSTNEQAFGTVYAQGAIETCCSVAWMALTIDMLRLTGDATVADELELTTWNEALGAQHPSGNWSTYNTALNGTRAPSYHEINFQYRPGTPELNCCSVNAPRMWGMLSEWAVMEDAEGWRINYYGPGTAQLGSERHGKLTLTQETEYPVSGVVRIRVAPEKSGEFTLNLRIPAWSKTTAVSVNKEAPLADVKPGTYQALRRVWNEGDVIELKFDMTPRYWQGQGPDRGGCAVIYRGPLLLAFDAYFNGVETADLGTIDVTKLALEPVPFERKPGIVTFAPMGLWQTKTDSGQSIRLCDFATAGAHGTDYAAWLHASNLPPTPVTLKCPDDKAAGKPGAVLFRWSPPAEKDTKAALIIAKDAAFAQVVVERKELAESHYVSPAGELPEGRYHWKVQTANAVTTVGNLGGPRSLEVSGAAADPFLTLREDALMASSLLAGDPAPSFGKMTFAQNLQPASGRKANANGAVAFGPNSGLRYQVPFFPERDYSFQAWVCPEDVPGGYQEVFSCWSAGLDDPLRVCIDGGKVYARIEAGNSFQTPGVPVEKGVWFHVAAVKQGKRLALYFNGQEAHHAQAPEMVHSRTVEIGLGFNPLYSGGEHFTGRLAEFEFYARALSQEEIQAHARP